jgi:2-dehydropantoate 2-reductase
MKHILFYGSGAVNLSLMGWISRSELRITVLARPNSAEQLRQHGVEVELGKFITKVRPEVVTSLDELEHPDLVVIGVKAYTLDTAASDIRAHFGREIPVLSVLNGVRHIDFLRSKFTNVLFATICFNAYRKSAYRAVAMSRGPIILTYSRAAEKEVRREVFNLLKGRVEVLQSKDAMDVACNKLIVNLSNALMTMVAFHNNRDRELRPLQHIMARMMWEGVKVMRAHGIHETKIPGLPTWRMMLLSRYLPQFITVPILKKKLSLSAINSMAQDVESGQQTEIEELNGHFVAMASKVKVAIPYNKAVYRIFKEWVSDSAAPITPSELLDRIKSVPRR